MHIILALDLGRFNQKTHGGYCYRHGTLNGRFQCPTNEVGLSRVFSEAKSAGVDTVVFEAQPAAFMVADLVAKHGMKALIANTHEEGFAYRSGQSKSDRLDVERLASMAFRGEIDGIAIPSQRDREQRSLVSARAALVEHRTSLKNRIRGLGEQYWLDIPAGDACWSTEGLATLQQVATADTTPEGIRFELASLLKQFASIEQEVTDFDDTLRSRRKEDPRAMRLSKEVPGFGPCLTDAFLARITDRTLLAPRAVAALIGLAPTQRQSGKTLIPGPISRAGDPLLRGYFVESAHVAVRCYPEFQALMLRLTKGKTDSITKGKAIVAIARRLAVLAAALLKSGKPYDPERIMPKSTWPQAA